jgi:hypothetical protein
VASRRHDTPHSLTFATHHTTTHTHTSGPDLKTAYNRAAYSHTWKQIRVYVEDDSGLRITDGADSMRLVQLRARFAYFDPTLLAAASAGAQASWTALDEAEINVSRMPLGTPLRRCACLSCIHITSALGLLCLACLLSFWGNTLTINGLLPSPHDNHYVPTACAAPTYIRWWRVPQVMHFRSRLHAAE